MAGEQGLDTGADKLTRDKYRNALLAIVEDTVQAAVREPAFADAEVLNSALLLESPAAESAGAMDAFDLTAALRHLVSPRLAELASQGYAYDLDLLVELLESGITARIEANAVKDGPLKSLAESLRAERQAIELRRINEHLAALEQRASYRFDYTPTVRRFAAGTLLDREAELTELREFCGGSGDSSYACWSGVPWAGKTALRTRTWRTR